MNPMQAMPQQAPMGGQPPMGPMGGPPMGGPQGGFSMPARGVNLFKIQEQLKDMPQQAVMAYANGQNPDLVPPYIALGEMERRSRAAKNAQPSQAPQGTVKDNLEQQIKQAAGLASLAGQKQQQMQQQQMSQSMQAPGPVPGNIPPPQDQAEPPAMMADGGLATLPVRDRMVSYRDGGIVGYAAGDLVKAPNAPAFNRMSFTDTPLQNPDVDEEGLPRSREERARILDLNARLAQRQREEQAEKLRPTKAGIAFREQFQKPDAYPQGPVSPIQTTASQAASQAAPSAAATAAPTAPATSPEYNVPPRTVTGDARKDETLRLLYGELDKAKQQAASADPAIVARAKEDAASVAREINRAYGLPVSATTSGGPRPGAAPAGLASLPGAPAAPTTPGAMPQAPAQQNPFASEYQKELTASRALSDKLAAPPPPPTPEQQALLNMPVEQDYMKRLRELAAKRGEEDVRTRADIEERKQMDLTRALLAGAESSRGYRGLGSLASGFARSSLDSRGARMGEEAALRTAGLSREELLEKAQFEMDTLQRARAEGNREKERASREKLLGYERELSSGRLQGLASVTGSEIGAESREGIARANAEIKRLHDEVLNSKNQADAAFKEKALIAKIRDMASDNITAQMKSNPPLMLKLRDPAALAAAIEAETKRIAAKEGITMPAGPGAPSPGAPLKYNPATGKIE